MADEDVNRVEVVYEAVVDEPSFERAEARQKLAAERAIATQAAASAAIAKQAAADTALLQRVERSAVQGRQFHGTPTGYDLERESQTGTFFSPDPGVAAAYSKGRPRDMGVGYAPNIRPAYLDVRKAFDLNAEYKTGQIKTIQKAIQNLDVKEFEAATGFVKWKQIEVARLQKLVDAKQTVVGKDIVWGRNYSLFPGDPGAEEAFQKGYLSKAGYGARVTSFGKASDGADTTEIQVFHPKSIIPAAEVEAARARQQTRALEAALTSPAANAARISAFMPPGGGKPPAPPSGGSGGGGSGEPFDDQSAEHLRAQIRKENAVRREGQTIAGQLHRDQDVELQSRVAREAKQAAESAAIQRTLTRDEQVELQKRVANESRQAAERAAIQKAMNADEAAYFKAHQARGELGYATSKAGLADAESLQRQRSAGLLRVMREEGQTPGGGQRGLGASLGLGQGSNFALRRSVMEAGSVGGVPLAGGIGSLAIYGPAFAAFAVTLGAAALAIYAVKTALEDASAETKFEANIRSIGTSFQQSSMDAAVFKDNITSTHEESLKLATAFARVRSEVQTKPGDIEAISTIARAKGQTPDEAAKVLEAISKGNKGAFETETGLKANVVIDEYARSVNKLPGALNDAARAQALYNAYVKQGANYEDLAARQRASAGNRVAEVKAGFTDAMAAYGNAFIDTFFTKAGWKSTLFANTDEMEKMYRAEQDARVAAPKPVERALTAEQQRQKQLEDALQATQLAGEAGLKRLSAAKPGETPEDRLKAIRAFRDEFQTLTIGVDTADERIVKISEDIDQRLSQSFGQAIGVVDGLAKSIGGSLGEFTNLVAKGEKNPFIKLYTDSEDRARQASERFRLFGDEVVSQYNRMAKAADEAAQYDLRVASAMKVTGLEFQAAELSKPFTELTAEMKRSLSVLQAEVGAAATAPGMMAKAKAIDLFSRFREPLANERAFGLFGVSETSQTYVQSLEFGRLQRLGRAYSGEGRGGEEARHVVDLELVRLFGQMDPRTRAQMLQGTGRAEYSDAFGGAFRREAAYSEGGVEKALQRAEVSRGALREAQAKLAELDRLRSQPGADRDRTRAEYLAITGALPREELTPAMTKGRIEALREEALFQKNAENRAMTAYKEGKAFQEALIGEGGKGGYLGAILSAIQGRNEQVTLRVLDESARARVDSLGRGFN